LLRLFVYSNPAIVSYAAPWPIRNAKPRQSDVDRDAGEHRRQEEALDEALKNTFPASDPVSVEQPTTSGRAYRS
jgi:hypothetical protein